MRALSLLPVQTASFDTVCTVGVFYDYWKISDSEISNIANYGVPIGQGLEPKNTTDEYGVQVKYRF